VAADMPVKAKFTVAICCFNSSGSLKETLQNLVSVNYKIFEVLVVDDGSVDNTREIAETFGVSVIRHDVNLGYGAARKSALDNCTTEIIAFIDDSCLVDSRWLEILTADWQNATSNIKAIAGPMEIVSENVFLQKYLKRNNPFTPLRSFGASTGLFKRIKNHFLEKRNFKTGYVTAVPNGNLSMDVQSARLAGGYDKTLWFSGEDDDICQKIIGHYGPDSILFDSNLVVRHRVENFSEVSQRNYRYGKVCGYLWRRNLGLPIFQIKFPLIVLSSIFVASCNGTIFGTIFGSLLVVLFYAIKNPITKYLVLDSIIDFILMGCHNLGFFCAAKKSPKFAKNV
jgi:glycosyltransferase involved in cell wall biosynthesis